MTKFEVTADYLETVDMLKVFANTVFRHVRLGKSYHQVARGAVVVDSASKVTRQEMLTIIPKNFYLCSPLAATRSGQGQRIPVCP